MNKRNGDRLNDRRPSPCGSSLRANDTDEPAGSLGVSGGDLDGSSSRDLSVELDRVGLIQTIPRLWLIGRRFVRFGSHTTDHVGMDLASYADYAEGDKAYPSVATLARDTGLSARQVSRALKDLRQHALIYQTQRGYQVTNGDGSLSATASQYVLTWPNRFVYLLDQRTARVTEACALVAGACGCSQSKGPS